MYFKNFNLIPYVFNIGGKEVVRLMRDITTNVRIRTEILPNITVYDIYDFKDGDTPDIIAAKYYGSSQYHWAIMLANEMYDYDRDFPKSGDELDDIINDKYNRFEATSWSCSGTTVTATIPGHDIELIPGGVVSIYNAFVINSDAETEAASYMDNPLELTATSIEDGTVTFEAEGPITGTPVGGLTLYTYDRQYGVHHYEIDGYVVNADGLADEDNPNGHSTLQREVTGAEEVSNYDHEVAVNDKKRRLKMITPDIVARLAREFSELVAK